MIFLRNLSLLFFSVDVNVYENPSWPFGRRRGQTMCRDRYTLGRLDKSRYPPALKVFLIPLLMIHQNFNYKQNSSIGMEAYWSLPSYRLNRKSKTSILPHNSGPSPYMDWRNWKRKHLKVLGLRHIVAGWRFVENHDVVVVWCENGPICCGASPRLNDRYRDVHLSTT